MLFRSEVDLQQVGETTKVEKVDPQKVEKQQCRESGSIDYYIPLYTFIYPHILSNIEYWENNGQHKTQKWL